MVTLKEGQNVPELFTEIMKNHDEQEALKAPDVIPFRDVHRFSELKQDMEDNLKPSAERMLRRPQPGKSNRVG